MSRNRRAAGAGGRPGTAVHVGREWVGWTDLVAHPNARAGAGGPGTFSRMPLVGNEEESDLGSPWQPGPIGAEPLDKSDSAPKAENLPPDTNPRSLGIIKEVQSGTVDYKIEAEIVADGSTGVTTGANTEFTHVASTAPSYESQNDKITKFSGKFTFTGKIQIQTSYAADSTAKTVSCYGRGTTATDVKSGDITLGFHESCHRADYEAYLKAHALPDPPTMTIGMKPADYDAAADAVVKAINKYWADMKADSIKKTDEVGFTLSKANKTNSCYVHQVP
jgi:hypothetical protein